MGCAFGHMVMVRRCREHTGMSEDAKSFVVGVGKDVLVFRDGAESPSRLRCHTDNVRSVSMSADGGRLISGCESAGWWWCTRWSAACGASARARVTSSRKLRKSQFPTMAVAQRPRRMTTTLKIFSRRGRPLAVRHRRGVTR